MRFQGTFAFVVCWVALLAVAVAAVDRSLDERHKDFNFRPEPSDQDLQAKRDALQAKREAQKKAKQNRGNDIYHPSINDIQDPELRGILVQRREEKLKRLQRKETHKLINEFVAASRMDMAEKEDTVEEKKSNGEEEDSHRNLLIRPVHVH
ncbi:expressed unknown protein [Seminavis robusta]|uniref:Uncharacterized protein n=1 Tax=Seminavis robusta TaxID=568900 RepID=A0A9N8EAH4_9STRA|nr:expressed unknown protein [Seminavis robusta]|eukprot:Sro676_g185680.1 n/a (151) ;mRNA; r:31095-31634